MRIRAALPLPGAVAVAVAAFLIGPPAVVAEPSFPAAVDAYRQSDLASAQWWLDAVNAPAAWTVTRGAGTTIAVLDSGVSMSSEFAGRIPYALAWNGTRFVPVDPTGMDDEIGHGTHVAGIVGAAADGRGTTGIAPEATILPVDLSELIGGPSTNEEFSAGLALAISSSVAAGADVINMSVGVDVMSLSRTPALDPVCRAIADAADAGTIVVVSAGNSGDGINPLSAPAGCPDALSVAALEPDLTPASWSSADTTVGVSAPGVHILSTWPTAGDSGDPVGYAYESGTSMAAPIVAGVAALVRSANPGWTARQVRDRVIATAHDVGTHDRDPLTGAGAVDAAAALGVPGFQVSPQPDIVVTLASDVRLSDLGYPECGPCAYVSWKPFNASVAEYSVTRTRRDGTESQTVLPRSELRFVVIGAVPGDWVRVDARLDDGRMVPGLPSLVRASPGSVELGHVTAAWLKRDVMRVSWVSRADVPPASVVVQLWAGLDAGIRVNVPAAAQSVSVRVPASLAGLGLTPNVIVGTENGDVFVASGSIVRPQFPAAIRVVSAGQSGIAIIGTVSDQWSNWQAGSFPGFNAVIRTPDGRAHRVPVLESGTFTLLLPRPAGNVLTVTVDLADAGRSLGRGAKERQEFRLRVPPDVP